MRLIGIGGTCGVSKTYIVTAGLTTWRLLRPQPRSADRQQVAGRCGQDRPAGAWWIGTVAFLKHLTPGDSKQRLRFNVAGRTVASRQPSVTAVGIGGQTEGNRAHTIIADDIETLDNSIGRSP